MKQVVIVDDRLYLMEKQVLEMRDKHGIQIKRVYYYRNDENKQDEDLAEYLEILRKEGLDVKETNDITFEQDMEAEYIGGDTVLFLNLNLWGTRERYPVYDRNNIKFGMDKRKTEGEVHLVYYYSGFYSYEEKKYFFSWDAPLGGHVISVTNFDVGRNTMELDMEDIMEALEG